jgi:hypothetical protein
VKKTPQQIVNFCYLHDIEIVSYGLAPNPNGFCYEVGDTCAAAAEDLDRMLDALSTKDEQELRRLIFETD